MCCLPIAFATNQPYNVVVTNKYVKATSMCSCGAGSWSYSTHTFRNYCPQCHSYGTLHYSKHCDAGQWTCSHCDCDYCMQCGKEKISGTNLWLRSYTIPKVTKKVTNSTNITNMQNNTVRNVTVQKIDPVVNISGIQIKQSSLTHVVNNIERWII